MSDAIVAPVAASAGRPVVPHLRLREHYSTLRQAGIAAHHYPRYVNDELWPHDVDVVLLTFVRSGSGRHVIGSQTFEIRAPSVAVTLSRQPHSVISRDGPLDIVNVFLDTELHPLPTLEEPLNEALAALIPLTSARGAVTSPFAELALTEQDRYEPLLQLLLDETDQNRSRDLVMALRTALLSTLACALIDRGLIRTTSQASAADQRVLTVRSWLDHHYLDHHTLGELAGRAFMERTYFSHRFRQVVGMPVSEYIARLRIRYAVGLLQNTDKPIAAVASTSGFHDLSHFGRTFRRLIGTSPRDYRREARAIRESGPGPSSVR